MAITIVSPTPGVAAGGVGGFSIDPGVASQTPIVVQITTTSHELVQMACPGFTAAERIVCRDGVVQGDWAIKTIKTIIGGGYQLAILPSKGWAPNILSKLAIAVDTTGGNNAPTANFTYALGAGLAVSFTDTSTDTDGTVAAWAWSFGDITHSSFTKTGGGASYSDAGAQTLQTFAGDGWIEASDNGVSTGKVIGLGTALAAPATLASMQFAASFHGGDVEVYEGGSYKLSLVFVAGDKYRVRRVGTVITYERQIAGVGAWLVQYTSLTASTGALQGGVTIFTVGAVAQNVTMYSAGAQMTLTWQSLANVSQSDYAITSALQNPTHTYLDGGTYSVQLTVTDNLGAVSAPVVKSVYVWQVDATSAKAVPIQNAEWTALLAKAGIAMVAPDSIWGFQETAGNIFDVNTLVDLAGSGSPLYAQTVAGWTRKGGGGTDPSGALFNNTSATALPNLTSSSMLLLLYVAILATPGATRDVLYAGSGSAPSLGEAQVNTSKQIVATLAGNVAVGVNVLPTTVFPLMIIMDRTNALNRIITNTEIIAPTYTAPTSGKGIFAGAAGAAASSNRYMYMAAWYGAKAEKSNAILQSLLTAMGW